MLFMERGDAETSTNEPRLIDKGESIALDAGQGDTGPELRSTPVARTEVNDQPPLMGNEEATDVLPGQGGSDTHGDSRSDERTAYRQMDRVLKGLKEVGHLVDGLLADLSAREVNQPLLEQPVIEQREAAVEIQQQLRELHAAVTDFGRKGPGQDPSVAASIAAQQAALASDIEDAGKRFPRKIAWSRIWEAFKRVVPHLWALIAHLTRVKEWSVAGQIGGGVLGLASAGITVTFG